MWAWQIRTGAHLRLLRAAPPDLNRAEVLGYIRSAIGKNPRTSARQVWDISSQEPQICTCNDAAMPGKRQKLRYLTCVVEGDNPSDSQ